MNIVICGLNDWAGMGYHLATAINQCTDHHATQFVENQHRFKFPVMTYCRSWNKPIMKEAMDNADFVLHGSSYDNYYPSYNECNNRIEFKPKPGTKEGVWHQGSDYRRFYKMYDKKDKRGKMDIVFTHLGLGSLHKGNIPLQHPFPVKDTPVPERNNKIPVIGHSPSIHNRKGSNLFESACERLLNEGYDLEVELCEGTEYKYAFERKKRCDIIFDQIMNVPNPGGALRDYGLSLVEGATLGCACLEGSDIETPAYKTWTEDGIYKWLKEIIPHWGNGIKWNGRNMRKWAEETHDYSVIGPYFIEKLEEVFKR